MSDMASVLAMMMQLGGDPGLPGGSSVAGRLPGQRQTTAPLGDIANIPTGKVALDPSAMSGAAPRPNPIGMRKPNPLMQILNMFGRPGEADLKSMTVRAQLEKAQQLAQLRELTAAIQAKRESDMAAHQRVQEQQGFERQAQDAEKNRQHEEDTRINQERMTQALMETIRSHQSNEDFRTGKEKADQAFQDRRQTEAERENRRRDQDMDVREQQGWARINAMDKRLSSFLPMYDQLTGALTGGYNRRTNEVDPLNNPTGMSGIGKSGPAVQAAQKNISTYRNAKSGLDQADIIMDRVNKTGKISGSDSMMMLSLHIATTLGGVPGVRMGRDMIMEHLKARDLPQDLQVMAQKVTQGGVLSKGQMQNFHELIKEKVGVLANQSGAAAAGAGVSLPSNVTRPGAPPPKTADNPLGLTPP